MKNEKFLVTVTEKGIVKISPINEIKEQQRAGSGVKVCSLSEKSGFVVDTAIVEDLGRSLLVVTSGGKGIKFPIKTLRIMGRVASGVIAIRISSDENVVSVNVI